MHKLNHYLERLIKETITELGLPTDVTLTLERPTNPEFGDFSANVAMVLFSHLKSNKNGDEYSELIQQPWLANSRVLADYIVQQLLTSSLYDQQLISQISVAGPGFINFTVAPEYLVHHLALITTQPPEEIISQTADHRSVIVEYSSPNIAKPFTIGHLRSTIIGDAVANILAATGCTVFRDNHLGDWGTQFGKQIYAIKYLGQGSEAANMAAISQSDNPVKLLVDLYIEFHQKAEIDPSLEDEGRAWFQKLEAGDSEARRLWQFCVDWSLAEFRRIYQTLGVIFTENPDNGFLGYGESFFEDKMAAAIAELEKVTVNGQPLLKESEGAKLIFYPEDKYPPLMLIKKDGATLYATRDLATDWWRLLHYGKDVTVINEVGAEQSLYFNQLFEAEALAGWYQPGQRVHVKHGLYRFKDKKMSTRKGNVIWLQDVLDEAMKRATQAAKDGANPNSTVARAIGVGALKWNDLKRSSHLDVVFDWDDIINLKGNSGPYIQYTFVRCHSLLTKAGYPLSTGAIAKQFDISLNNLMQSEKAVLRELLHFDSAVQMAASEYAPHYVCTYLYQLAQTFNAFYAECPVLSEGVSPESKEFRLQLTQAVSRVLAVGLGLLGIQTVEQM